MADNKKRLGKGLSALFGEAAGEPVVAQGPGAATPATSTPAPRTLPIASLQPGKFQPRRRFDEEALQALIGSIREQGVVQPLLVRPIEGGKYEIVAGERRWRAAQAIPLHEVPVVIRELDDRAALEIGLVENIQRADLTPLEEAEAYRRLIEEFGHTQEALSQAVGKSRSHIANTLRLLYLPGGVKALVEDGKLTAGHARAVLTSPDPEALATKAVNEGLSVREVERLAQSAKAPANGKGSTGAKPRPVAKIAGGAKDPDTLNLEKHLSEILGLAVDIQFDGKGGSLTIAYDNLEQLDDLTHRLQNLAISA
ncbi:ParB/RepB/Spo0J family partition protein [Lacibacterium aquatile]|uniref:ParB/RepB/Spo0J family partition protein n=1 Tax=Lacibacterium aquatile TaxID=1168082 RepID=A0ABW5DWQ5_9PROT